MEVNYDLIYKKCNYVISDADELTKLNFLLTNSFGDFLNCGVIANSSKFQGLNYSSRKSPDIFKIIDEIIPNELKVKKVNYKGYKVEREFENKVYEGLSIPVNDKNKADGAFGEKGQLDYDENGILIEKFDIENEVTPNDSFHIPNLNALVYEINNFKGDLFLDLDMKKRDDFDEFGRNYKTYKKDDIYVIEFWKDGYNSNLFLAIRANNLSYVEINDWVKKEYSYSKERNSLFERYVYRPIKINVNGSKKIYFTFGESLDETLNSMELITKKSEDFEKDDASVYENRIAVEEFVKPITNEIESSYLLSKNAMYNFVNSDLNSFNDGTFAGYPWFSDVWTRDDIISLRAFINMGDIELSSKKIMDYVSKINDETGGIDILLTKKSNNSCDSVFFLAKRTYDLIEKLNEQGILKNVFSDEDLNYLFDKFSNAFNKIANTNWDFEKELINVKYADSWMDTIERDYPLEMQVLFLEFVSFMAFLSEITSKEKEAEKYLDLEDSLAVKIRKEYYRDGILFDSPTQNIIRSNVFLSYYIYPELFMKKDWEIIFDHSLKHLKTSWGGISTLSKNHKDFCSDYSGENNLSYHNGDSWFWINNIAALSMNHLNEKKYRDEINKIVKSSTYDILQMGTIGYGSEISSASKQKSEGCLAQAWSSSTYIEMIDSLFLKK